MGTRAAAANWFEAEVWVAWLLAFEQVLNAGPCSLL